MNHEKILTYQELGLPEKTGQAATRILETNSTLKGPDYLGSLQKRSFDIALSSTGASIFLPIMLLTGARILAKDGWPPYIQIELFHPTQGIVPEFKARTMVKDAQKNEGLYLTPILMGIPIEDQRILPGCDTIRKGGTDELPQLLNVLTGDLSLVGPRGITRTQWDFLKEHEAETPYGQLIYMLEQYGDKIKYGMAGFYGAFCRGKEVLPQTKYGLEVMYCQGASFRADLKLLFLNFGTFLRKRAK